MSDSEGQQHPISVYLWIWLLLFVLSAFSYAVDYMQLQGMLRWSLILIFMVLKAGFIVAICGQVMTMPGLPRHPAAEVIGLDPEGHVEGLF